MNFFAVSGVAATRRSPSAVSLRTAIFIRPVPAIGSARDQQDDDEGDDQRDDRSPFHQALEETVGPLVDLELFLVVDFGGHRSPLRFGFPVPTNAQATWEAPAEMPG